MSAAKKGLGRGFESLIPTDLIDDTFNPNSVYDPTASQDEKVSTEQVLPLSRVVPNPDQPRRQFDEAALEELAASIKEHGVIQPIVVVAKGDVFEIVAGERRFRASQRAGLKEIPALVRTYSAQHQLEVSLIENIQRRDLNSIETATAYAKLRDQFNLTNDQIAQRVNKSASSVINTMRLLKLPKEVIALIANGTLSEGQARPLIGQDEAIIVAVLERIVKEGWSARKVEQYIVGLKKERSEEAGPKVEAALKPEYEQVLASFRQRLGDNVKLSTNTRGTGRITIDFHSQEEFEKIKDLLAGA